MTPFILVIAVVPRNKGDAIARVAVKAGAGGGTILLGRGTASNKVLQILGIGDTGRDVFISVIDSKLKTNILDSIKTATKKVRPGYGVVFTTDVLSKLQSGVYDTGEDIVEDKTQYRLITVILNKGFADDAMAAARAAGARGGTILNARGTAREGDTKFLGVHIVPEKEMLLLIVEEVNAPKVFEAVRSLPCLKEPGSGIIYSSIADDFTILGR